MADTREGGNDLSGSIKCGEFLVSCLASQK